MSSVVELDAAQREFFALVSAAVFANPFSAEREQINTRLAGLAPGAPADQAVDAAIARVQAEVAALESAAPAVMRRLPAADRRLVEVAVLFDVFHRYLAAFDRLILDEIAADGQPQPVPFAGAALALLEHRGIAAATAARHVAIFYQLRRAYYFIATALVGVSPCMRALRERLWSNVFTGDMERYAIDLWNRMEDFSTLLLGETGAGKGAAAQAIGRSGFIPFNAREGCFAASFMRSFVALNLSQFPESLIESELFGHRKGAFTGAINDYEGVLSRCSAEGAIFLDEIGDLSAPVQIKLLRVLQERTYSPVGSHEVRRFSGRVIAATHQPLDALRRGGRFRDDFYYRLCSDVLLVPPLRQRIRETPEELDHLVALLLQRLLGRSAPDLTAAICGQLRIRPGADYAWPGNVRELEQAVRRILLTGAYAGEGPLATADAAEELAAAVREGTVTATGLLSGYCRLLLARHGTYGEVARRTGLDWRTVRKYVQPAPRSANAVNSE